MDCIDDVFVVFHVPQLSGKHYRYPGLVLVNTEDSGELVSRSE